jgi:hypothetical protein
MKCTCYMQYTISVSFVGDKIILNSEQMCQIMVGLYFLVFYVWLLPGVRYTASHAVPHQH